MTPSELELRGQLLYGRLWQVDLARNVGVSRTAVVRWKLGRTKIKPEIEEKIDELLAKRIRMIHGIIAANSKKETKKIKKCSKCAA